MSISNDAWRDSYDEWKLRSPYDDDDPEDECPHEDYEIDILSGRGECSRCNYSWNATDKEIADEIDRIAAYHDFVEQEERRERWRRLWRPIAELFARCNPFRRAARQQVLDDDIPF